MSIWPLDHVAVPDCIPTLPLAFVQRSLEIAGFHDRFDVVLSAHEVAAPKPAPDPYLVMTR